MKTNRVNNIISLVLVAILCFTSFARLDISKTVSKAAETKSVYFGRYVQDLVTDEQEKEYLSTQWYEKNHLGISEAVVNGVRIWNGGGTYFREVPIEWKVLKDEGDCYVLMSKKILEWRALGGQPFWDESDLRKYLNETFINDAFSDEEQNDIKTTRIKTTRQDYNSVYIDHTNETYEVETEDKVYVLSSDEVQSLEYGFDGSDESRVAYQTDFRNINNEPQAWWLRGDVFWSTGNLKCSLVDSNGKISSWYGTHSRGIRPVIRVSKSSKCLFYEKPDVSPIAQQYESFMVSGSFKDGQLERVFGKEVLYNDEFFIGSSDKMDKGLAELSMLAASCAYNEVFSEDFIDKCKFQTHKYKLSKPTKKKNDTISYEIGIRKVNNLTIVAIWVKGTSGDYEWVSNWNLGTQKVHKGFSTANKNMKTEIEEYLKNNNVELSHNGNTKIWITGHSRGAAVANLFAKDMNGIVGHENVYAYTFATPRVARFKKEDKKNNKKNHPNIFNFLNPGDFVTEVAPKKWGYERYGIDKELDQKVKSKMKAQFKTIAGVNYTGFGKEGKKSLLNAFLDFAGNTVDGYKKKHPNYSAEYFCKYGLGYILKGDLVEGGANCAKVMKLNNTIYNLKAKRVFAKMFIDGKVNGKFGFAHTQLGYMCWLDQMEF